MKMTRQKDRITRREFLELSSLASAGVLASQSPAIAAPTSGSLDPAKIDSAPMTGKIALEEHFALPETVGASYAASHEEWRLKILDMGNGRIADMDRGGVQLCILSLTAPGIQAIPGVSRAINLSRRANDYLAEHISKYPKRMKGFAALPMQDPRRRPRIDSLRERAWLLWCASQWFFANQRRGFSGVL